MAKKKEPVKLKNLIAKGKKRFGEGSSEGYDFLKERETLVANHQQKLNEESQKAEEPKKPVETKPKKEEIRVEDKVTALPPQPVVTEEKPKAAPIVEPKIAVPETVEKSYPQMVNKNRQQTVSKEITKGQQRDSKEITNGYQKVNQSDNQTDNNEKWLTDSVHDYRTLVGNEKNLLYFIYHECLRECGLETGKLPIRIVANHLNTTVNATKVTIFRMRKKNLIHVVDQKRGRAGWSRYGINKDLYQKMQSESDIHLLDQQRVTKELTKRITKPSSSSSNLLNNNITTRETLPEEWKIIEIPDNLKEIRFGKPHIIQIFNKGTLGPEDVQESVEHFAYDLANGNVQAIRGPLNLLMGTLIKQGVPYISESLVRELREARREREAILREYEDLKKEESLRKLTKKFEAYWSDLSQDDINRIAPPSEIMPEGSNRQKIMVQAKFYNEGEESGEIG